MSDLVWYKNRTNKANFSAKQDGAALNLTGATLKFAAKTELSHTDGQAVFTKTLGSGIVLTSTITGIGVVTVNPSDTFAVANLKTGLFYELQVTLATGEFYTLDLGKIFMMPVVVSATS